MKSHSIIVLYILIVIHSVSAQELEPRAYANLPKALNAIALGYTYTKGNVILDPSIPISDLEIVSHNVSAGYMRTFSIAGKIARVQIGAPLILMNGDYVYQGADTTGARSGFGDLRMRIGMNIIGGDALAIQEFSKYEQKTIVGFSVVISAPTGQYFPDKLVNLGTNRWGFKPEIGASKRFKKVYIDLYTGVWFYTDNPNFYGGKIREQNPVFSLQAHGNYTFKNHMWLGINGNWFWGGDSSIDGYPAEFPLNNSRVGITWSTNFSPQHSVKLQFNTGAFSVAGYNYNSIGLSYQFIFF